MKFKFLGSCREVGRSGVIVHTGQDKVLFDYGLKIENSLEAKHPPEIPKKADLDLDGILISHAHLDHTGMVPNLYKRGYHGDIFSTGITFNLMDILLRDTIKIAKLENYPQHFSEKDLKSMVKNESKITYGQNFSLGSSNVDVINAGHIPGSCSYRLEPAKGKRVLYTGDIKTADTQLVKKGEPVKSDILITESTYAYKSHPDRKEQEKRVKKLVKETIGNNGVALFPVFAVDRAQEVLLILKDLNIPIYMDGMAVDASKIILNYPELVHKPKQLKKVFLNCKTVKNNKQRKNIIKKPCVILTTAGMMDGGPVVEYMEEIYKQSNSSIILTGFQVEGSRGHEMLKTGVYRSGDKNLKLKCHYEQVDLSAHIGRDELLKYIKRVNPEKIFCIHGDRTEEFAKELRGMGFDARGPKIGEKVNVE